MAVIEIGLAVDGDGRPGDEDGLIRDQEGEHGRQLRRLGPAVVHRVRHRRPVGRGVDDARHDAVDPYPLLAALRGRRLNQPDHPELAHAVGKAVLALFRRHPAGHEHERPAALRGQHRHGVLGDDRRGHQVQLELLPQHRDVQPGQRLRRGVPADQVDDGLRRR